MTFVRLAVIAIVAFGCRSEGNATSTATTHASSASSRPPAAIAIDSSCRSDGCLRSAHRVGHYDKATIVSVIAPGAEIDNGYSVYTIAFFTSGREARATVAVPYQEAPPAGGYHLIANNHGTTGLDDPCAVVGTLAGAGLAGTFAARGLIGVAVDYPGLGTEGSHPYLVSESEGRASLDALRATRLFAALNGVALSKRMAIVGLSQGGHATLAAAAAHRVYAPDLDIRAFAAVGPASVFEEHWRTGARYDGELAAVHAMLVYAWGKHYGYSGPPLWTNETLPIIDQTMQSACMYSATGAPTIPSRLGTKMSGIFAPGFLAAYRSGVWGDYRAFGEYFRQNRVGPYEQTAPLKIYQGDADTIVPEAATRQLVDALRAGGVEVDYEVVAGGAHGNVAFGFVAYTELRTEASIQWLRRHLDASR